MTQTRKTGRARSIENLKPWKKGQSGNPGGYSRGRRMQASLHEVLDRVSGGQTLAEAVNERIVVEALNGSVSAYVAITNITDGTPRQAIEHSGPDGAPIGHTIADLDTFIEERLRRGRDRASAARREGGSSESASAEGTATGTGEPK